MSFPPDLRNFSGPLAVSPPGSQPSQPLQLPSSLLAYSSYHKQVSFNHWQKNIYNLVFLITIIPGTTAPPSVSPHHLSSEIIFTVSFIQRIRPSLARMTMDALKASMYIQKGRDVKTGQAKKRIMYCQSKNIKSFPSKIALWCRMERCGIFSVICHTQ